MNIPYYLQDLPIGPEPGHKVGKVHTRGSLLEKNLLDRMAKRGTGISRQDMQATLALLTQEIADALADGWAINTPRANYVPSIKGVFNGNTDPFDPKRHHFRAAVSEGTIVKRRMRHAIGERISIPLPVPLLIQYTDHGSHTADSVLTPDNIGEINGQALKYDLANEEEGIFLVPENGGQATKVTSVSIHTEGRLMFMVPPSLTVGEYIIEVRRSYTKQTQTRIGTLHHTLTVG
ncbi:DNA-binding domain-containing protein [Spongiimicrobium sp. 2-473A-2-J]|uniref:DNA-binding domain-containing protein n=1 Tax=Eudoraea algarum TaxID=3417568 RepID=UPI003D36E309